MRFLLWMFLIVLPATAAGCGRRFGVGQGEQQMPRNSNHYAKKIAAQRIDGIEKDNPGANIEVKKVRKKDNGWLTDVEVLYGGKLTRRQYLVDDKGRVLETLR